MQSILNQFGTWGLIAMVILLLITWAAVCHIPEKEQFFTQAEIESKVKRFKEQIVHCEYLWQLQLLQYDKTVLIEQAERSTMIGEKVRNELNISYSIKETDLGMNQDLAPELKPYISNY